MPLYAVAIEKRVEWRAKWEHFSNVYVYNFLNLEVSMANSLADTLRDAEKPVHSGMVGFVGARVWGPLGNPATSDTILLKTWTGHAGTAADYANMDREACYVIRFDTNRQDSRSRKVYLRKWLHSCAIFGDVPSQLAGNVALGANTRAALTTYANKIIDPIPATVAGTLSSPAGASATGTFQIKDYVEHHEFT